MPSPASSPPSPRPRPSHSVRERGLDVNAATNLVTYLGEQREATQVVPSDTQIVVERFRDELGDWRLVVHSPYGTPVHAPWALAINARLRERFDVDGQAVASDDGIVIRIPDTDAEPPTGEVIVFEPDEIEQLVTQEVGGSALFASRFRECAARALLLPRRDPGRRSPLWQQRQRSAQLLEVASQYPSFPIVLEAVRECLQDVYDLPALVTLLGRDRSGARSPSSTSPPPTPSPYARSLLFGYVAQFVYEGDSPIAERRAAALSPRPGPARRAARPRRAARAARPRGAGRGRGRAAVARPRPSRPQRRGGRRPAAPRRPAVDRGDPRACRSTAPTSRAGSPRWPTYAGWSRSGWPARTAGPRSRTSAGCATASACPCRSAPPTSSPSRPRTRSATWSPATPAATARSPPPRSPPGSGLGEAVARQTLQRLAAPRPGARGRVPPVRERQRVVRRRGAAQAPSPLAGPPAPGDRARHPRRRSPASCRPGSGSAASSAASTAWSPPSTSSPAARCRRAPSSRWCSPPGCATTSRAMLDELTASGEVIWAGHAPLPGSDGWVSLHLADQAHLTLPEIEGDEPDAPPAGRPRRARPGRRVVLPPARRPGRLDQRRRARPRAVGAGVAGPGHQRHPDPAAGAGPQRHGRPTAPVVRRRARPHDRWPDARPHRSAGDGRPLGAAARARRRPDPACPRPRRAPARAPRRGHPRCRR